MLTKSLTCFPFLWSESCQCRTIFYKDSLLIASVSFDPYDTALSDSECDMDHQNKALEYQFRIESDLNLDLCCLAQRHFSYCNISCLNIY